MSGEFIIGNHSEWRILLGFISLKFLKRVLILALPGLQSFDDQLMDGLAFLIVRLLLRIKLVHVLLESYAPLLTQQLLRLLLEFALARLRLTLLRRFL